MITFPKELVTWLLSLPNEERMKETNIAERNLERIQKHLNK